MKITAGQAAVRVMDSWGIKHIYGIPGSSCNGLMDALYKERDKVKYIQTRHEAAGAMAASAHAKATRHIGAAFGSGGPGGSNLINGLYDAKMDRVPMLALIGQSPTQFINTTYFQEMNQHPLYADVSVFNRMAVNAEQIPDLIEEAIRAAYEHNGVAVVILPNDLVEQEIAYVPRKEEKSPPARYRPYIKKSRMQQVKEILLAAEKPVLYGGLGLRGAMDEVVQVSEKFSLPIVTSATSMGVAAPTNHPNFMGAFGRLGTKAAFDVMQEADLVLFVGSNMPFARYWPQDQKMIQVNNSPTDIGKQVKPDVALLADGKEFLQKLLEFNEDVSERLFLDAARVSKQNWDAWLAAIASDDSEGLPAEAVLQAVADYSEDDAFYSLDVGNNTMHSVRMLPFTGRQQYTISGWFATMGVGLPGSISAKLDSPTRQVWSISGDGGFAMNMQEIITQSKYHLPIINVVLTNHSFGFIQHAQILSDFLYGVDIEGADYAMAARGMGATSYTVRNIKELKETMDSIHQLQLDGNQKPILIDAKLHYKDPVDTSYMILDPEIYDADEIEQYKKTYNIFDQPTLSEIYKEL